MNIRFGGAGALAQNATNNATVTFNWPTGYKARKNDLAIVVAGGWTNLDSAPPTPTGFTQLNYIGQNVTLFLASAIFYKFLDGTESAPSAQNVANYSTANGAQLFLCGCSLVYSFVDKPAPMPVSATATSAATLTWSSVPSVTTTVPNSLVISAVISGDADTLALGTANGFTGRVTGSGYNVTIGVAGQRASIGVADRLLVQPSAATMCTWTQTLSTADSWSGTTGTISPYQFQPVPGLLNRM